MMNEKEVIKAAEQAYSMFSKKHKVDVFLEFLNEEEFFDLSSRSRIIHEEMKEGLPIKVGSLVVHSGRKETIVLCKDVINLLTKDPEFVKALVLHELFHVLDRSKVKGQDMLDFIASEDRVHKDFKKEFPKYAEMLEL
ncbi:MAG: hypothetical protein ABH849_05065 [Nanoarchaeota archaeon]